MCVHTHWYTLKPTKCLYIFFYIWIDWKENDSLLHSYFVVVQFQLLFMSILGWTTSECLLCSFQLLPEESSHSMLSLKTLDPPDGARRSQFVGKNTRRECQWPGVGSWGAARLCLAHTPGWPPSTSANQISAPALWSRPAGCCLPLTASSASTSRTSQKTLWHLETVARLMLMFKAFFPKTYDWGFRSPADSWRLLLNKGHMAGGPWQGPGSRLYNRLSLEKHPVRGKAKGVSR